MDSPTALVRPGSRQPRARRRAALTGGVGLVAAAALVAAQSPASASAAKPSFNQHRAYVQTNLVSDVPGAAAITDPHLVNAWGLSQGPTTPLWVSDNGMDVTTLYTDPPGGSPAIVPPRRPAPGPQLSAAGSRGRRCRLRRVPVPRGERE